MEKWSLWGAAVVFAGACSALSGCGTTGPSCDSQLVTNLSPTVATADHAAKAPGNQQQFQAIGTYRATRPRGRR